MVRRRRGSDDDDDHDAMGAEHGGGDDASASRQRSHCGGGKRSVVRTKQLVLVAFARVAMGADRMAWALFCVAMAREAGWCVGLPCRPAQPVPLLSLRPGAPLLAAW